MLLLLTTLLVSTASIFASSGEEMIVRVKKGPSFKSLFVQLVNLQEQDTRITILDRHGKTWFEETLEADNGYSKLFHLEKVPNGIYFLAIRNKGEQEMRTFQIQPEGLALFEAVIPATSQSSFVRNVGQKRGKPAELITHFTPKEGKVLHVQLANLMEQPASIEFGDLRQPKWFTEDIKSAKGYAKDWKLEGLKNGDYYLLIQTQGRLLIQEFSLQKDQIVLKQQQQLVLGY